MYSSDEIMNMRYGCAVPVEQLTTSATTTYTINTFERGEMIRVQNTADSYIRLCRDFVWGGNFGGPAVAPHVHPLSIWATDTEGSELNQGRTYFGETLQTQEQLWSVNELLGSGASVITLDKTGTVDSAPYGLEFALDSLSDVLVHYLNGRISRSGKIVQEYIAAGQTLSLHIRHLDSAAGNPLEYQIEEGGDGTNAVKYWTGAAWTTTEADGWVTITGSGTAATFLDVVTTDRRAIYKLRLRSKIAAAQTSNLTSVGLCEAMTIAGGSGTFVSAEVPYTFIVPFRSKVGCDAAGAGLLDVVRMLSPN